MDTETGPGVQQNDDPYRGLIWGITALFILVLPMCFGIVLLLAPAPEKIFLAESGIVNSFDSYDALVTSERYERGRELFSAACTACHGDRGEAKKGLGRDIKASKFVRERTDEEVFEYIKVGRRADDPLNTTGIDMPPKGGNPALSDEKIMDIIAYIRGFQAVERGDAVDPITPAQPG